MSIEVKKLHTFTGHNDSVYSLQPADEDHLFFSAAGDGMVVLWNLMSPDKGELIARLPNSIYAIHHMKVNGLLIAAHNYDGIHLLDWKNKTEVGSLQFTKAAIFDLQSWEGQLFVATGDGVVLSVDISRLLITQKVHLTDKSARTLAVNPVRGELAIGYSDHYIRVVDIQDLSVKYEWQAHDNSVFALKYSKDGRYLLSGSRDAKLKAWDSESEYKQAAQVAAHLYAINHVEFSPDAKHFVTCSMDKSIKLWDFRELKLLKVIDKARHAGHGTSVNKLLWTSFHQQLLSASDDRTVSSWNFNFLNAPL